MRLARAMRRTQRFRERWRNRLNNLKNDPLKTILNLGRKIETGVLSRLPERLVGGWRRRRVFQGVYRTNLWGIEKGSDFFSGVGSRGESLKSYVETLSPILSEHIVSFGTQATIVDIGCGDFRVARALLERLPRVNYIGCDIVPELIKSNKERFARSGVQFALLDAVGEELPAGQICLVRQVFQHLSNWEIAAILKKLGKFEFVYITEGQPLYQLGSVNPDKPTNYDVRYNWRDGRGRGVELNMPPFDLAIKEICRGAHLPGTHELIVTHQVFLCDSHSSTEPAPG